MESTWLSRITCLHIFPLPIIPCKGCRTILLSFIMRFPDPLILAFSVFFDYNVTVVIKENNFNTIFLFILRGFLSKRTTDEHTGDGGTAASGCKLFALATGPLLFKARYPGLWRSGCASRIYAPGPGGTARVDYGI